MLLNLGEIQERVIRTKSTFTDEHSPPEALTLRVLWGLDGGMQRKILDM